jgi:hypothetical protein
MDRFDERHEHDHSHDHEHAHGDEHHSHPHEHGHHDETRETDETRVGEVLGLGGAPVPKAPGDPVTEYDAESIARRRERAMGEEADTPVREDPDRQRSGATGIDMGSGGQGTHLSGK